ncbi:metal-sulfur cluster assembly factor [Lactobacillus corticis]|uniref:MIP18 family-like domain-containing protein n=1 Tax=Lactobacillus corticis TaxID=2201249 RepID=A0A916VGU1_9LACO|nr:metal-sulfur cluster assembly factor [Lactobacillus corticis]GFZ26326.1 hypothetical protein LCB40_02060 [Lactobacillus corticis]
MRDNKEIQADIMAALGSVIDPELQVDIVNLGLIYDVDLDEDGICLVTMTLTIMGCPLSDYLNKAITKALLTVPEIKHVDINLVWYPAWSTDRMSREAKLLLGIH